MELKKGSIDFSKFLLGAFAFYAAFLLFAWGFRILVDSLPFFESTLELEATVAIFALLASGLFQLMNRNAARTDVSHLSLSHEVSDRRVGRNSVHVSVNVVLEYTSQANVNVQKGNYRFQQMAVPYRCRAGLLCAILCGYDNHEVTRWEPPEDSPQTWQEGELIIEPGQRQSVIYEFEVRKLVRAVKITTSFDTPATRGDTRFAQKWEHTSVYDIAGTRRGPLTLFR